MSAVHRHRPDLLPEEADRAVLYDHGGDLGVEERVERDCRDCGASFTISKHRASVRSKWYSLCPSCLYWEI